MSTITHIETVQPKFFPASREKEQKSQVMPEALRMSGSVGESLPMLPGTKLELERMVTSKPVPFPALLRLVMADPCLAAQVLRIANTQKPAFSPFVGTITKAVSRLEPEQWGLLARTSPVLDCTANPAAWPEMKTFWQHSYFTARIAAWLAAGTGLSSPDLAYTAGLLHDIGVLPFITVSMGPGWALGLGCASLQPSMYSSIAEAGQRMSSECNFPAMLTEVCSKVRRPVNAMGDPELNAIITVADRFSYACGIGLGILSPSIPVDAVVVESILEDALPQLTSAQLKQFGVAMIEESVRLLPLLDFKSNGLMSVAVVPVEFFSNAPRMAA